MSTVLELAVEVPQDLAEEFEKKLAYVVEGLRSVAYDPRTRSVRLELASEPVHPRELIEGRIQEIAAKIASSFQPGFRRSLARRDRPGRRERPDPHSILISEDELREFGRGRMGFGPKLVALLHALDQLILRRFAPFEPAAHQFPSLISGEVLDRCRYLKNFPVPHLVAHLREDLAILQRFASEVRWDADRLEIPPEAPSPFAVLLAPSVCFHWYAWLAGVRLAVPRVITARESAFGTRARRSPASSASGTSRCGKWCSSGARSRLVSGAERPSSEGEPCWRIRPRVRDCDGDGSLFIDSYAGQAAFQRGFELKYELLCPLPYREKQLAVGSVNYHQDFFGRAFDIDVAGAPGHTACIGFGSSGLRWLSSLSTERSQRTGRGYSGSPWLEGHEEREHVDSTCQPGGAGGWRPLEGALRAPDEPRDADRATPDAFSAWVAGIAPLLGRFAFVVVAEEHGMFVGFVAGRVRMLSRTSASSGWASSARSSLRKKGARSASASDFSRGQSNGIARTTSTGSSCRSWQTIRMGCGSTNGLDGGRNWCS